ncbi:MAG: S9 family peptidase [Erysipelotrichaceae bacterium]|nr:S9 family peptidase [Erysipelotrichaceae bacterium]
MKKILSEDLLKFSFLSGLSFNRKGDHYAYTLAKASKKQDSYDTALYIDRKLYKEDKSVPLLGWYDDDNLIITIKSKGKSVFNTYYLLNAKTLKRKIFLKTPLVISSFRKINDVCIFKAGIDSNYPDLYLYNEQKLKKHQELMKEEADYEVLDEIPYWLNGAGFINKKRQALFTIEGKKIKRITGRYTDVSALCFDDDKVCYSASTYERKRPLSDRIYSYDLKKRKIIPLYEHDDQMVSNLYVLDHKLYVSACDGKKYGINETAKFALLENGEMKFIETPDRSLYDSAAVDTTLGSGKQHVVRNDRLYTLAANIDHIELWVFDKKFQYRKLLSMPLIAFFDVNDERIVFCGSDETSLPELYEYTFKDRKIKALTSYNKSALKDKYIARVQEIKYVSAGYELNGWVLPPINYSSKKKYPAVLDVHGGPRAIYSKAFFHEMQIWASEGYFVMFTNIKGSDGRGDEFADIRGHYGDTDFENLMDFVDAVLEKYPAIDKDRLCETGGSYGGFMTNWIITHTDRFKAAASQRSISNWTGFTYLSDIGFYFATDQNGTVDGIKDYQKLWDHSPLKYVDNVKTPTLFIHSDEDYRCPLPEGMQMMQALAERDIETRLVVFHKENHELSRGGQPKHRLRRLNEITSWFNKHVK